MDLVKKTTILFAPDFYEHLTRTAKSRGASLGQLVREACEAQYGTVTSDDRVAAVACLRGLSLPTGTPRQIKRQSIPKPKKLR